MVRMARWDCGPSLDGLVAIMDDDMVTCPTEARRAARFLETPWLGDEVVVLIKVRVERARVERARLDKA